MSKAESIDGALVVDKPAGPTSHDVVRHVRRLVGTKTGHTGTLDPAATGVLIMVLGRATRLSSLMTASDKEYLARVRLGRVTESYDAEGAVVEEHSVPPLDRVSIEAILDRFRGTFLQTPPMFSAIKVAGEPLYRAARRHEVRERPDREVTISELELLELDRAVLGLRVVCSSGTYIRSLAHDIGQSIGCGGFLEVLRRTRSGHFRIERAVTLERLTEDWREHLIPLSSLLPELPMRQLSREEAQATVHGNPVPDRGPGSSAADTLWRLFFDGDLLALAEYRETAFRPKIVLQTDLPD